MVGQRAELQAKLPGIPRIIPCEQGIQAPESGSHQTSTLRHRVQLVADLERLSGILPTFRANSQVFLFETDRRALAAREDSRVSQGILYPGIRQSLFKLRPSPEFCVGWWPLHDEETGFRLANLMFL